MDKEWSESEVPALAEITGRKLMEAAAMMPRGKTCAQDGVVLEMVRQTGHRKQEATALGYLSRAYQVGPKNGRLRESGACVAGALFLAEHWRRREGAGCQALHAAVAVMDGAGLPRACNARPAP